MRHPFLALLARGPAHGYEVKQAFESTFGQGWPPLNAGQVYTTLGRLERDGLVEGYDVAQDDRPNKRVYQLTDAGRDELRRWLGAATDPPQLKDEFFLKLVMAVLTGLADPAGLLDRQRRLYLRHLRHLEDLAASAAADDHPVEALLVEGAALHLQADLEWLDRIEERLVPLRDEER